MNATNLISAATVTPPAAPATVTPPAAPATVTPPAAPATVTPPAAPATVTPPATLPPVTLSTGIVPSPKYRYPTSGATMAWAALTLVARPDGATREELCAASGISPAWYKGKDAAHGVNPKSIQGWMGVVRNDYGIGLGINSRGAFVFAGNPGWVRPAGKGDSGAKDTPATVAPATVAPATVTPPAVTPPAVTPPAVTPPAVDTVVADKARTDAAKRDAQRNAANLRKTSGK